MDLGAYLQEAARRPFVWGEWDCCTFPADWFRGLTGTDPMARWRGGYSSEEEARALIAEAGGLTNLWGEALDGLSTPVHGDFRAGDVGVCLVVGERSFTQNGGIYTGRRWAFLGSRGLFVGSIEADFVQRAWRP